MVHIHREVNSIDYCLAIFGMLRHVCPLVNAVCCYIALVQWMMNFSLLSNLQNTCSGSPHNAVSICLVDALVMHGNAPTILIGRKMVLSAWLKVLVYQLDHLT